MNTPGYDHAHGLDCDCRFPTRDADAVRLGNVLADAVEWLIPEALDRRDIDEMRWCAERHGEDDPCSETLLRYERARAALAKWRRLFDGSGGDDGQS